jgi:hypothetical protein
VILRRGMLKSFDMMLNTDIPTAAEASSTGPAKFIEIRVSDFRQTTKVDRKMKMVNSSSSYTNH